MSLVDLTIKERQKSGGNGVRGVTSGVALGSYCSEASSDICQSGAKRSSRALTGQVVVGVADAVGVGNLSLINGTPVGSEETNAAFVNSGTIVEATGSKAVLEDNGLGRLSNLTGSTCLVVDTTNKGGCAVSGSIDLTVEYTVSEGNFANSDNVSNKAALIFLVASIVAVEGCVDVNVFNRQLCIYVSVKGTKSITACLVVNNCEVLDLSVRISITLQATEHSVCKGCRGRQVGNGVVLTVKGSVEAISGVLAVVSACGNGLAGEVDVCTELNGLTLKSSTGVKLSGELNELISRVNGDLVCFPLGVRNTCINGDVLDCTNRLVCSRSGNTGTAYIGVTSLNGQSRELECRAYNRIVAGRFCRSVPLDTDVHAINSHTHVLTIEGKGKLYKSVFICLGLPNVATKSSSPAVGSSLLVVDVIPPLAVCFNLIAGSKNNKTHAVVAPAIVLTETHEHAHSIVIQQLCVVLNGVRSAGGQGKVGCKSNTTVSLGVGGKDLRCVCSKLGSNSCSVTQLNAIGVVGYRTSRQGIHLQKQIAILVVGAQCACRNDQSGNQCHYHRCNKQDT